MGTLLGEKKTKKTEQLTWLNDQWSETVTVCEV